MAESSNNKEDAANTTNPFCLERPTLERDTRTHSYSTTWDQTRVWLECAFCFRFVWARDRERGTGREAEKERERGKSNTRSGPKQPSLAKKAALKWLCCGCARILPLAIIKTSRRCRRPLVVLVVSRIGIKKSIFLADGRRQASQPRHARTICFGKAWKQRARGQLVQMQQHAIGATKVASQVKYRDER